MIRKNNSNVWSSAKYKEIVVVLCVCLIIFLQILATTVASSQETPNFPIIVWWTSEQKYAPSLISCGNEAKCFTTTDRSYFKAKSTRGFIFYGTFIDELSLPLPRAQNHQWGLLHEESPMNKFMLVHRPMIELFNYTSTFKRQSDIPLTTFCLNSLAHLLQKSLYTTAQRNELKRSKGLAPIAYIQSHCNIASDRDRYVRELMQYIQIDSYGQCVHNKDLPEGLRDPVESMESPEFLNFISQYKFHLSMENAICDDYMTEKLFRPFYVGSVPIYKGSPSVKDWLPAENSAILIDDFGSPQELAKYIKTLDNNDTAYEEMLSYKTKGIQNNHLINHIKSGGILGKDKLFETFECYVCEKVYANYQRELAGEALETKVASKNHLQCPQPDVSVGTIEEIQKPDE